MRRRIGFLFIICAAVPVAVFASTAWACGVLATLTLPDPADAVAAPNEVVTVEGRNFGRMPPPRVGDPEYSPVQIRWGSRTGPILAEVPAGGNFSVDVRIPRSASPGWYVINATQFDTATGVPKSGTPGRTTVRVQGAAVASTAPWGAATPPSGGPGSPDLPLPGILLSVALLATGLTLVFRDRGKKASRVASGA